MLRRSFAVLFTLAATSFLAPAATADVTGPVEQLTMVDPALAPHAPEVVCPEPFLCPEEFAYGALPARLTPFGELLFFVADDGVHGAEPWVSDGTVAGTSMIADLCPGECDSVPQPLGVVAGRVVFFASTPGAGVEPWATDGTAAGTRMLADLCPGGCDSSMLLTSWWDDRQHDLDRYDGALADGELFFPASDGFPDPTSEGAGLYATDGVEVRRVASTPFAPRWVVAAGPGVAFMIFERLWWSDGTAAGTRPADGPCPPERIVALSVPPIPFLDGVALAVGCGGPLGSSPTDYDVLRVSPDAPAVTLATFALPPTRLATDGDELLFAAAENRSARPFASTALWRSDGTPGGTSFERFVPLLRIDEIVPFADRLYVAGDVLENVFGSPVHRLFEISPGSEPRQLDTDSSTYRDGSLRVVGERLAWWESPFVNGPIEPIVAPFDHRLVLYPGYGEPEEVARFTTSETGPGGGARQPLEPAVARAGDTCFLSADGGDGQQLWRLSDEVGEPDPCADDPAALCLRDGRFLVRGRFTNQHAGGAEGVATPDATARATGGDTGYFWFFRPGNLELAVKVLDGRPVDGHWWVFAGGTTDLGYELEVTDRLAGVTRTFVHAPGDLCSIVDTRAFDALPGEPPSAPPVPKLPDPPSLAECVPGSFSSEVCVGEDDRFQVFVEFVNQHDGGATGSAAGEAYTDDTAVFRFFPRGGTELMVKVLDGRPVNGHFWVFWGGLTDLGYTIQLFDRVGNEDREYVNPPGSVCGGADTKAF